MENVYTARRNQILALGLSVIAITLAVLATRTQTPVDTRKSTSTLEEQGSEATLKR